MGATVLFVCGDCTPAVATQGSDNATGLRTAIEDLKRRCKHGRLLADWCTFCEKDARTKP